jgi:hypothetical protein
LVIVTLRVAQDRFGGDFGSFTKHGGMSSGFFAMDDVGSTEQALSVQHALCFPRIRLHQFDAHLNSLGKM